MEKENSKREPRQQMEQTRDLFCMCVLGVACCKSVSLLVMSLMFKHIAGPSELGSCESYLCNP